MSTESARHAHLIDRIGDMECSEAHLIVPAIAVLMPAMPIDAKVGLGLDTELANFRSEGLPARIQRLAPRLLIIERFADIMRTNA